MNRTRQTFDQWRSQRNDLKHYTYGQQRDMFAWYVRSVFMEVRKQVEYQPLDVVAAARSYLESAQTKFGHDRTKTVGSSEIGTCARKTAASKLSVPPDTEYAQNYGFTGRGNAVEDAFAAPMLKYMCESVGGKLMYAEQANQISLVAKGVPLSATPDGIATNMPRNSLAKYGVDDIGVSKAFAVEIKSIDPRYNKAKLPKASHTPQLTVAMGLVRRATDYKPDYGLLIYIDASDFTEIAAFVIPYSESAFNSLKKRAAKIMAATNWNEFMPEGKINGGGDCQYCQFAKQCLGYLPYMPAEDRTEVDQKSVNAVMKAAKALKKVETSIDTLKQSERDAEAALIQQMTKAGTRFIKTKAGTVVWKNTASQTRLDGQAMKAKLVELGVDVSAYEKTTKPGTTIKVELS
jgi:CRISPR/Cas system-associated exonuclease Cas4 (RecB family)